MHRCKSSKLRNPLLEKNEKSIKMLHFYLYKKKLKIKNKAIGKNGFFSFFFFFLKGPIQKCSNFFLLLIAKLQNGTLQEK